MKRLLLATSGVLLLALVIHMASCGELDPAVAPSGSSVSIVGPSEETWSFNCMPDIDVPSACYDAFRDYCVASCALALQKGLLGGDAKTLYDQCVGTPEVCSEYVCDDLNQWTYYCEDSTNGDRARNYIWSKEGRCGFMSFIRSAIVTATAETVIAEGGESVTQPLNGVEVVWIATGGEMYELDDIPGTIPPLANPHYDETNERGVSEIKYRVPLPNLCGSSQDYILQATIGVAYANTKLTFTVSEEQESDDDTAG